MGKNYGNSHAATNTECMGADFNETPQQRYERELREWEARTYESDIHKAMSKPNPPGYYRANND